MHWFTYRGPSRGIGIEIKKTHKHVKSFWRRFHWYGWSRLAIGHRIGHRNGERRSVLDVGPLAINIGPIR